MLALTNKPAKLASINVRAERHGDEPVTALDLGFTFDTSNDALTMLSKSMRSALYYKASGAAAETQASLDGVEPVSDTPNRRLTCIDMPMKIDAEWTAFACEIGHGAVSGPIVLTDCTVAVKTIDAKEGGTVTWQVRVQKSKPGEIIDALGALLQSEVTLTLEQRPSDAPKQGTVDDEQPKPGEPWPFPKDPNGEQRRADARPQA